jgi:hypothetical protein
VERDSRTAYQHLLHTRCAQQYHLLASCGVKILEASSMVVYNFKAQASLHLV